MIRTSSRSAAGRFRLLFPFPAAGHLGFGLAVASILAVLAAITPSVAGEIPRPSASVASEPLPLPASGSSASPSSPITITDVVAMQQSGLDDQVIVNAIRQSGMATPLSTAELISLRRLGVSNAVISAMQSAAPQVVRQPAPPVVQVYETPPPPVVIRSYATPSYWYYPRPHYHGRVHYHHRSHAKRHGGPSFGIGITWR